jgi:hypothetical protein
VNAACDVGHASYWFASPALGQLESRFVNIVGMVNLMHPPEIIFKLQLTKIIPFIALMMDVVRTSETFVNFNVTTRRYIQED